MIIWNMINFIYVFSPKNCLVWTTLKYAVMISSPGDREALEASRLRLSHWASPSISKTCLCSRDLRDLGGLGGLGAKQHLQERFEYSRSLPGMTGNSMESLCIIMPRTESAWESQE